MMVCFGLIHPASSYLIPQLKDEIGFEIDEHQGSWIGMSNQQSKLNNV